MEQQLDLLTISEAGTLLRLKDSTVRSWILKRRIPFIKLGGRVFLRIQDCLELVEASRVPAKQKTPFQGDAA